MKNKNLLKTFFLILLVTVVLTWIIPGTSLNQETSEMALGTVNPEGLLGVFGSFDIVGQFFFQNTVLVLIIGIFYGIINKTGAYKELVEGMAKKLKKKETAFLVISIVFFVAIPALTNLYFLLFLFVPFFMSVLREMGYKKNIMLVSTVGSILVGYSSQIMNGVYADAIQSTANPYLLIKIFYLLISIVLIALYCIKYENKNDKKSKEEYDSMIELETRSKAKTKPKALKIILILLFVFFILGFINWKFDFFLTMHEAIMGVQIGKFAIFAKLFGAFNAFGNWWTGEFYTLLLFTALIVALVYKLSLDEIIEGIVEGIKKFALPALMVGMMVLVTVFSINSGFVGTILNFIVKSGNSALVALGTILGAPFIADPIYVANYAMPMVISSIKTPIIEQVALITQLTYGLTMLLVPTSAIMVAGMTYLEIDYKNWFKYVWKLAIVLFGLAFIAIIVSSFIK